MTAATAPARPRVAQRSRPGRRRSCRSAGRPSARQRPLCLVGLDDVYGLHFGEFVTLDAGGALTRQALQGGHVDVALLFTTDPAIDELDLVELADDRGLQPAENITPLVRREVIDRGATSVVVVIDAVSARLTTAAVRELNAAAGEPAPTSRRSCRSGGRRSRRDEQPRLHRRPRGTDIAPPHPTRPCRRPCTGASAAAARPARHRRCRAASAGPAAGWIVVTRAARRAGRSRCWCPPWARRVTDQVDACVLRGIARLRTGWLTTLARGVDRVATGWTMFVVGGRPARGDDRVQAVAAPVHVPRQRHRRRGRRAAPDRRVPAAAPLRRHDIGRWQGFSLPSATVAIVSITVVGVIYMLVVPGRPRPDRQGRRHRRRRGGRDRPGLYLGRRPSLRRPRRRRPRGGHPAASRSGSSPPTRSFPVTYRRRQDRPPRRRRAARRGAAPRRRGSARRHRRRRQAGRPRRLRRLDAAAAAPRRRPDTYVFGKLYAMNHVRADRWYKTRPHDPLRAAGGRGAVPDRAPARAVRGLRAAGDARRRPPDGRAVRHRRADARARVPARHRVLRRRASRSATPRSTTRSSTRASPWCAGCGTPGSPTATSSRPT